MCGLCGFVMQRSRNRSDWASVLRRMTNTMSHRGPDQDGYRIFEEEETIVALGHRRLTIIDITERGTQPISNEDETLFIIYNGEIYNYRHLGAELRHLGHRFKSDSDTEVILHLYEERGLECIEELRGMFAFALWDCNSCRLLLARDRIGVKPLFYAPLEDGIVFASEIKSILMHPAIHVALDSSSVDSYLALGYVPGPRTIFKNINALLPGQRLLWSEGALEASHYWEPSFLEPALEGEEADLVDELDGLLNDSVRHHLVSDVPVGTFLSGGIDSSLVTAIAQKQNPQPIETFTIGFSEGRDERLLAGVVARHVGSHHHEELARPDLAELLPRLIWHLEQPLFDNSVLPTFLVSELASRHGKVVLSGDGGDESFAGYDWTRFALILPQVPVHWKPENWEWLYKRGKSGFLKRLLYDLASPPLLRYLRRMTTPALFRHWLYTPKFSSKIEKDPTGYLLDFLHGAPVRQEAERFLYSDLRAYLPEDVLFKVDRMSMAHGLEVRVPLLDHKLLEWLFRLPFQMRFRHGRGKYLLRKVAARYLPPAVLKPRKQGFTIPIDEWLRGALGETAETLFSSEGFVQRGIVSSEKALLLLEMHRRGHHDLGHRIWSLMVLEVWARIWLDGQSHLSPLHQMIRE